MSYRSLRWIAANAEELLLPAQVGELGKGSP